MPTKIITREGYDRLKNEHDYLWNHKRPEITKIVSWAASLGDRSENADYTYNKRVLRQIDKRIHFLRKVMSEWQVVDYAKEQEGRIFFGAWVTIKNDNGNEKHFRIAGPEEIYGENRDYISVDSPMARALLKKCVGDEAKVKTPEGIKCWEVVSIEYKK